MSGSPDLGLSAEDLKGELDRLRRRVRELEVEHVRLRLQERASAAGGSSTEAAHSIERNRYELFSAVENARIPMILTDPNQLEEPIIFANRAFQELCGYGSDALLGRNCRFLQGPETDRNEVAKVRMALAERRDVVVELVNYRRDGTPFVNELFISPVYGRDGRLLYHLGSQLDLTGHHRTHSDLEAAKQREHAIFNSAVGIGIIATGPAGRVTDWNTGAERILGWTAAEMCGETVERIFTPEDRAAGQVEEEMRKALQEGRASDERWHARSDGSRFWASGEMMPLRDTRGAHLGFLKILRDRTSEHQAGEALREAEASLRRAQAAGGIGVYSLDVQKNELKPTPEFCRLFGIAVADRIAPETIEQLIIPEDAYLASSAASRAAGTSFRTWSIAYGGRTRASCAGSGGWPRSSGTRPAGLRGSTAWRGTSLNRGLPSTR